MTVAHALLSLSSAPFHAPEPPSAAAPPTAFGKQSLGALLDAAEEHVRTALPAWLLEGQPAERVRDHVLAVLRAELLRPAPRASGAVGGTPAGVPATVSVPDDATAPADSTRAAAAAGEPAQCDLGSARALAALSDEMVDHSATSALGSGTTAATEAAGPSPASSATPGLGPAVLSGEPRDAIGVTLRSALVTRLAAMASATTGHVPASTPSSLTEPPCPALVDSSASPTSRPTGAASSWKRSRAGAAHRSAPGTPHRNATGA